MKNRKRQETTSSPVLEWIYFHIVFSTIVPSDVAQGPALQVNTATTAELWRWGATTHFFQETGLQVCCWGQRFLQSPPASSRKTTSAWLNPAAFSSPQWGHRFLQADYAVTCAEPLAPGNQGNQNLLDVPCFSSPQYQTGIQLAASTDWNNKIRKKQK